MNVSDVVAVATSTVISLGGGAGIITAVSKWYGNILAQRLLSNIQQKHEEEIAAYKSRLDKMSTEFTKLVEHSIAIATKQYDMEIEIYQKIWGSLFELSLCLKHVDDFMRPVGSDPNGYVQRLQKNCEDFESKLDAFQKCVDSVAPFYQENVYEDLYSVMRLSGELLEILKQSISEEGMSQRNKDKVISRIIPEIVSIKEDVTKKIRDYLFSLKSTPAL